MPNAEPTCTLNPKHSKRTLETQREQLQGYCDDCAEEVASSVVDRNKRASKRQAAKDKFIADNPQYTDGSGTFVGESVWLSSEEGKSA